jgi:uncharacterized membrane protein YphA (DoxX/SURF4 family)
MMTTSAVFKRCLLGTTAPHAALLIRMLVGGIFLSEGLQKFISLQKLARYGFWSFLHEARADLSMWIGSLFLLVVGAGPRSLDAL